MSELNWENKVLGKGSWGWLEALEVSMLENLLNKEAQTAEDSGNGNSGDHGE